jgi:S1-C subfamily serine protease
VTRGSRIRLALGTLLVVAAVAAVAVAVGLARGTTGSAPVGAGVVVIETSLGFQGAHAAGTGMVLTSSGRVLTNNHVIRGATDIRVVVPKTGRSFPAKVVGYDESADVAVLQAGGASDLRTAPLGDSDSLDPGEAVKALGNAGGTGSLRAASGTVTGLDQAITVGDDQGGSESLPGMIETNAHVQPGDSGGPLMNASGQVVGMDTAASVPSGPAGSATGTGFAIPINTAMSIAGQIVRGDGSARIHVGGTAFLGVEVVENALGGSGAVVTSVVPGSPAEAAGLTPGDLITAVGDQAVSSPSQLTDIVAAHRPGASVSAAYVDPQGASQTASLALASGPPH